MVRMSSTAGFTPLTFKHFSCRLLFILYSIKLKEKYFLFRMNSVDPEKNANFNEKVLIFKETSNKRFKKNTYVYTLLK